METLRFNIIGQAHRRLRSDLDEVAFSIQQTSFRKKEEAEKTIGKIKGILEWLENYREVKKRLFHLALCRENAVAASGFSTDWVTNTELTNRLLNAINEHLRSSTENERINAGIKILLTYNQWASEVEELINQEETTLNMMFWDKDNEWYGGKPNYALCLPEDTVAEETNDTGHLVYMNQPNPVRVWRKFISVAKQELQIDKWKWLIREMFRDNLVRA
jgi:hypothetical protein